MKEQEIVYYSDELNDEFSGSHIEARKIDEKYNYSKNSVWDFCSFLCQNILSMPIKYIYSKKKFKIKYIGKEKFKECKNSGYFIYANHTQVFGDTFFPSLANFPKRNFFIVNPENISIKGIGHLVEMLGAIPIPDTMKAYKNFLGEIENRINKKCSITIYPEAHIWPYCTKIRNFKSVSFKYPVNLSCPVFSLTNTYQKYGKNRVQIVSYIDGPFFPDENIESKAKRQAKLRNEVYNKMVQRSKMNNIEIIKYVER